MKRVINYVQCEIRNILLYNIIDNVFDGFFFDGKRVVDRYPDTKKDTPISLEK